MGDAGYRVQIAMLSEKNAKLASWFNEHANEHAKFDNIPLAERRHALQDVCAMIYLHEKTGTTRGIEAADHDIVYLSCGDGLTESDVGYLVRCGVSYDRDNDNLFIFR